MTRTITFWTTVIYHFKQKYKLLLNYCFYLDVPLHNENVNGDIGNPGSLHRLLRGLAAQKAQMRDEFITAELTNHLFQSGSKLRSRTTIAH